jgi:hypothetical protein
MNQELEPIISERIPLPFSELVKIWLKVAKMTEAFFREELGHVSVANTLFGIMIIAVFTAASAIVTSALSGLLNSSPPPSAEFAQFKTIATIWFPICGLIVTPFSFYLNIGLTYLGAHIFGGKGDFKSQAYLVSLFSVPLSIISVLAGLLSLIPIIGLYLSAIASLGISIFQLILTVRVLKVVHMLSTGKAVAAVLSPLVLLLIPLCMISVLGLLGPAVSNVFSGIISELGTPVP